jgi:hypothetical protein
VSADAGLLGRTKVDELLSTAVLDVAGHGLTGRDLVAAGVICGRWQRLEADLSEGLGLVAAHAPPASEVRDEVRAFRLERRFLSAEDLRSWMRPRGLRIADLNAFAARTVARRRGGTPQPVNSDDIAGAIVAEAICGGALQQLGWWLADRLLSAGPVAPAAGVAPVASLGLEHPRIQQLVFAEACTLAGAASRESGLARAERLAWIAGLDDAHQGWEETVASSREVTRRLRDHALDWCRFELDELRLASAGTAAEAAAQLADGSDPQQVAATAGVPLTVRRLVLADASPDLARALAGAVVADVPGPTREGEDHVVVRVRERAVPDPTDQTLIARAREEVLADARAQLRAGKVRWHDRA